MASIFKKCACVAEADKSIDILKHYYGQLSYGNSKKFSHTTVQSQNEFSKVVNDASTYMPLVVHKVVLPEGMSMNNEYLRKGVFEFVNETTETLPRDAEPNLNLGGAGLVEIDKSILPEAFRPSGCYNSVQRVQVLTDELIKEAERNAEKKCKSDHKPYTKQKLPSNNQDHELVVSEDVKRAAAVHN